MTGELDLHTLRARKARLGKKIGQNGFRFLYVAGIIFGVIAVFGLSYTSYRRVGYFATSTSLFFFMISLWYYRDLTQDALGPHKTTLSDYISTKLLASLKDPLTTTSLYDACIELWPAKFILTHLLIDHELLRKTLAQEGAAISYILQQTQQLSSHYKVEEIDSATVVTTLILTSPTMLDYLKHNNLHPEDVFEVYAWLERLQSYTKQPKPNFGGIGRDWATGFAPTLEKYSSNISRSIELGGGYAHFLSNADVLTTIIDNLDHNTPVALVGAPGTGKSSLIYGLAERLLEGKDPALRYYQIISLNASMILSQASGQLERLMLTLFGEAIHAGNIIIYLDEAQLFFGSGVGAFNLSQLLLPILQNRRIKVIASFTPQSWQKLRATDESLTALFSPISINEPPRGATMKVLEDNALMVEQERHVHVTYQAVREAYTLSGQYMQDMAYPGKAINLLQQAVPYAKEGFVIAESVQDAIEKTRGVKVSTVQAPEADKLLHLEDLIHKRMINQTRAVAVVSSALRRVRAGVANPKRPIGSFLFLGPTGVGKTELARSLAAIYFGSERQMIRLDMSEYQRVEDVTRLLSNGSGGGHTLLMSIREQPFSVVLLDEVEKAHPQILNLLLQMLDEGQVTDESGKAASFRNAIIICTSNAGSAEITEQVKKGGSLTEFERPLIEKLIGAGQFKPELINRFDEVVLFRPLNQSELAQVAQLMLNEVNRTLSHQNIEVHLTEAAFQEIVKAGYDPTFGARPMRRIVQKTVEDAVAEKILSGRASSGSTIVLDAPELEAQLAKKTE